MSNISSGPVALNPVQKAAVEAGVDLERLPRHIGMIMDGNGRFATQKGLARLWGHHQGYKSLRTVLLDCSDLGIECLTVYAFSAENWRRPGEEVAGLMRLIEKSTRDEVRTMMKNQVRLSVMGRIEELPESLQETFRGAVDETAQNTGIRFCLAVNYGGRAEIVDAVKELMASGIEAEDVTEELISANLYCSDFPEPDMILRTAGEMRWSNFMIFQGAYSELVVTETTWPDFGSNDLFKAVVEFQNRTRKFGGLS